MQNRTTREISRLLTGKMRERFPDNLTSGFIFPYRKEKDEGGPAFMFTTLLYNFFWIKVIYEKGLYSLCIDAFDKEIYLFRDVVLESEEDHENFLEELARELELRIPDKYIRARGWERKEEDRKDILRRDSGPKMMKNMTEGLIKTFRDRVTDLEVLELNKDEFCVMFKGYNYFWLKMFSWHRGSLGYSVYLGKYSAAMINSQPCYETADFDIFFREMEEEIALRIPDKYLKARPWEKKQGRGVGKGTEILKGEDGRNVCRRMKREIEDRFKDRATDLEIISEGEDNFVIEFTAYDYWFVRMKLDSDDLIFGIASGEHFAETERLSQYDDTDTFFEGIRKDLELRIPDKYLKAKGWKDSSIYASEPAIVFERIDYIDKTELMKKYLKEFSAAQKNIKGADKLPLNQYMKWREASVKNKGGKYMTLGKFYGDENGAPAADSYIKIAEAEGDTYVDLGENWKIIEDEYGLSDDEMFRLFILSAMDDAVEAGKTIRFCHNPKLFKDNSIWYEYQYLKTRHGYELEFRDGYWYAE